MGARLLLIEGRVQRSPEGIVHLVAERLVDRSADLSPPLARGHAGAPRQRRRGAQADPREPRRRAAMGAAAPAQRPRAAEEPGFSLSMKLVQGAIS